VPPRRGRRRRRVAQEARRKSGFKFPILKPGLHRRMGHVLVLGIL
jgi:hypothetical protein